MTPASLRSWLERPGAHAALALATFAVAAVAAGVWLALDDDEPAPIAASLAAVDPPAAPPPAPSPEPAPAVESLPLAAAAHGDDEVEVCGVGWMPASGSGAPDEAALLADPSIAESRRDIGAALASSADEYARAVGRWIGVADGVLSEPARGDLLARDATATDDPRVYAMAFRNCLGKGAAEGACAMLSVEQWARLDPGNAMPWLYALGAAAARKDPAARDEALYQMSVAQRIEDRPFAGPAAIVEHARDDDRSVLAAWTLAVQAIGMSAAQPMPLLDLSQSCGRVELADGNRRQVCAAIAELLQHRSDSLLLQASGSGLGRRLGDDVDRIDRSRGESGALLAATSSASLACDDVRRELQRFQRAAQVGEAPASREQVSAAAPNPAPPAR